MAKTASSTHVVYIGEAVQDGTMEVRDLAPALLSLGRLIEDANHELNGDRATVSVRVASTSAGSFDVLIDILQMIPESVWAAVGDHVSAEELLVNIGLAVNQELGHFTNLIDLAKKLFGKVPDPESVTHVNDESVTIKIPGDTTVHVTNNTYQLYDNATIRHDLAGVIEPLRSQGIDAFESRTSIGGFISRVTKDELDAFDFYPPFPAEEKVDESTQERVLTIVEPSFQGGGNFWFFEDEDGNWLGAPVLDSDFIERVADGRSRFGAGDQLRVKLRTIVLEHVGRRMKGIQSKNYAVLEVLEHIVSPENLPLP